MEFIRQKAIPDANPESHPKTHPEINICEVCSPSWTVFTQENNELFIQQVPHFSQLVEGGFYYYYVLCLNL